MIGTIANLFTKLQRSDLMAKTAKTSAAFKIEFIYAAKVIYITKCLKLTKTKLDCILSRFDPFFILSVDSE